MGGVNEVAAGDALDLALGLLHAPARRELLAGRPLPAGMTDLLAVAAGSQAALHDASARTGATADELREAARFFVQQVLLVPGADAFRTLGATPDAPQSRLNEHHRLLQRWLHPDRDTDEAWDSAFSARVNAAWSRVRTAHARQAYSAELAAAPAGHVQAGHGASPAPADGEFDSARWGLAPGHPAISSNDDSPGPAPASGTPRTAIAVAAAVALAAIGVGGFVLQREPPPADAPAPLVQHLPAPVAPLAEFAAGASFETPAAPETPEVPVLPESRPEPLVQISGPAPAIIPLPPALADAHEQTPVYEVAMSPPDAEVVTDLDGASEAALSNVRDGVELLAKPSAPATLAVSEAAPVPGEAAPVTEEPADPFLLYEQAEHTVAQLTRWLASLDDLPPPIWNDAGTEAAAAAARSALQDRRNNGRPDALSFDSPRWNLGRAHAVVDGSYHVGGRRVGEQGTLQVELVRREERWLVTAVHMEPEQ